MHVSKFLHFSPSSSVEYLEKEKNDKECHFDYSTSLEIAQGRHENFDPVIFGYNLTENFLIIQTKFFLSLQQKELELIFTLILERMI